MQAKGKTWLDVKLGVTGGLSAVLADQCYNVLNILESYVKFVLVELKNCKLIAEVFVSSDRAHWIRMVLQEICN